MVNIKSPKKKMEVSVFLKMVLHKKTQKLRCANTKSKFHARNN